MHVPSPNPNPNWRDNKGLKGVLPQWLAELPHFRSLRASNCCFAGPLPGDFPGAFPSLQYFHVQYNNFQALPPPLPPPYPHPARRGRRLACYSRGKRG